MPLTDAAIRNAKPGAKIRKISDTGGLQVHVFPSGSKLWRYAYRINGKQRTLTIGSYPEINLLTARRRHLDAREKVANGIDPSSERQKEKRAKQAEQANTFAIVADLLVAKKVREGRGEKTMEKVRWLLSLVPDTISRKPIVEVTAREILAVLRLLEKRERLETARRLRSLIGEIFRLAIAMDLAENDPTIALRGAIASPRTRHHSAITDPARLGELLRAVDNFTGQPQTRAALQLCALLALRPGELRKSTWADVDLKAGVWSIEAERTKMRREHRTPLPPQAIKVLTDLKPITGHGKHGLIFPSARSVALPISENTLNAALRRLGFGQEEATAHGFRSSFSTLANESGLWSSDAIERQLAHVDRDSVRRAYARGDRFEERTRLLAWWADQLDAFRLLEPAKAGQSS